MKRKFIDIEDNISKEKDIEVNEGLLEKLQKKYDPDKELIVKISENVLYEFEESNEFIDTVNDYANKRYYKKLKIKDDNDKKKYINDNFIKYESGDKNICKLIDYSDKNKCSCIEVSAGDDYGLIVDTYENDANMVIVTEEQEENTKEGDKIESYYIKIVEKIYLKNKPIKITYF